MPVYKIVSFLNGHWAESLSSHLESAIYLAKKAQKEGGMASVWELTPLHDMIPAGGFGDLLWALKMQEIGFHVKPVDLKVGKWHYAFLDKKMMPNRNDAHKLWGAYSSEQVDSILAEGEILPVDF